MARARTQVADALMVEKFALVVRMYLRCSPDPPCGSCRMNAVECPLCRATKAAKGVMAEYEGS